MGEEIENFIPWRLFGGLLMGKVYSTPLRENFPSLILLATLPTMQPKKGAAPFW